MKNKKPYYRKTILILVGLLCALKFSLAVNEEEKKKQEGEGVYIIARALPDSILLRWAPSNFEMWGYGIEYGYKLERVLIIKDSALVTDAETEVLKNGIKPLPLNDWEPLVKANKYAGIAAQAYYGEEFEVSLSEEVSPQEIYQKSLEQQQRFSFSLFAADKSPQVALASGLMYTDTQVDKNEKYLYKLTLNLPDSLSQLRDTAIVFAGVSDYMPLPVPLEFDVEFKDRVALLKWNAALFEGLYMSWEAERSDDGGKSFQALKLGSGIQLEKEGSKPSEHLYAVDSFPTNDKKYQYRVRGVTSFGEKGPWSEIIKGKGRPALKGTPNIEHYAIEKNKIILKWTFPKEMESNIAGFRIWRSDNANKGYQIIEEKLKPNQREYADKDFLPVAYYKVEAFRVNGDKKESFPYLVQLSDSIPPKKPKGLQGVADTSYIVKLNWEPNTEEDLEGYIVFRSVSGNEEYSRLNANAIKEASFYDTLSKKDLNSHVYYKVAALDHRYNQSKISDVCKVEKPDIIPPANPVFTDASVSEQGINLSWIGSNSSDMSHYLLKCFSLKDTLLTKSIEIKHSDKKGQYEYLDMDAPTDTIVFYSLNSVDMAGNLSSDVNSVYLKRTKMHNKDRGIKINKHLDEEKGLLQLTWDEPAEKVANYQIFINVNGEGYRIFKTLPYNTKHFNYTGIKLGTDLSVRVKANYYEKGRKPYISEPIKIAL